MMAKWDAQLKAAIKPAANEAEAMLHGEIASNRCLERWPAYVVS